METRICKVCGKEFPLTEFKKTPFAPEGITTCNQCCVNKANKTKQTNRKGGGNPELARFTPRELIEELRHRGYKGELSITKSIVV